jgi:hypothetical protein
MCIITRFSFKGFHDSNNLNKLSLFDEVENKILLLFRKLSNLFITLVL